MNKAKILNYTTTQSVSKSLEKIRILLVGVGAQAVSIEHTGIEPTAIRFSILFEDKMIIFVLEAKANIIHKVLCDVPRIAQKYKTLEHAHRVAWRLVCAWVELQASFVHLEMNKLEELFLPFVEVAPGVTFYKTLETKGFKQLGQSIV